MRIPFASPSSAEAQRTRRRRHVTSRENVAHLTGFRDRRDSRHRPGRLPVTDGRYEIRAEVAKGHCVTLGKSLADVVNEPGAPAWPMSHPPDRQFAQRAAGWRGAMSAPSRVLEEIRDHDRRDRAHQRAAAIADEAWAALQPSIVPGVTEVDLSNQLEADEGRAPRGRLTHRRIWP